MTDISLALSLIANTVGIVSAGIAIVYQFDMPRRAASIMWPIAWLGLLVGFVGQGLAHGSFALTNLAEYLLGLAWALLSLHLLVWYRKKIWAAGLVLPPIALIATLAGWNLLATGTTPAVEPRGLFVVHTTLSTLGVAALGLAFTMSLIYLVQDRALKSKKRLSMLERLPALGTSDHLGYHAMLVGFYLLSLGMGAGVVMNMSVHDRLWIPGAKQSFAAMTWVVFAAVIASRAAFGFRGRKSAYLTIAGFILGLLTIVGMTL